MQKHERNDDLDAGEAALMEMCADIHFGLVGDDNKNATVDDYLRSALPILRKHYNKPLDGNRLLSATGEIDKEMLREVMGHELGLPMVGLLEVKNGLVSKYLEFAKANAESIDMDWESLAASLKVMCNFTEECDGAISDDDANEPMSEIELKVAAILAVDYEKLAGDKALFGSAEHITAMLSEPRHQELWLEFLLESYMVASHHRRTGFLNILFSTFNSWSEWPSFVVLLKKEDPVLFSVVSQFNEYAVGTRKRFSFSIQAYLIASHWSMEMGRDDSVNMARVNNDALIAQIAPLVSISH